MEFSAKSLDSIPNTVPSPTNKNPENISTLEFPKSNNLHEVSQRVKGRSKNVPALYRCEFALKSNQ